MNEFRDVFDRQKEYFATGVTRSYDWRVDQIDRVRQMVAENEAALQAAMAADFKTAIQETVFETLAEVREAEFQQSQLREWMKPVEAPVPRFLAETGHKGVVYREPYGVAMAWGGQWREAVPRVIFVGLPGAATTSSRSVMARW
jgi:aldehyde dehydrogenase (NAD+)